MAKTRYFIPFSYTISGRMEIIADSQEEAVKIATNEAPCPEPMEEQKIERVFFNNPQICGAIVQYSPDSFQIDKEFLKSENPFQDELLAPCPDLEEEK
jgi:hypothetical protein